MSSMPKAIRENFVETLGDFKTEDELIEAYQKQIKLMKNVKETLLTELNESQDDVATDTEPKGEEKEVIAENAKTDESKPEEKVAEKSSEKKSLKEDKEEKKAAPKKSEESKSPVEKVDYDILSEDFKRKEEKESGMSRLRYLAGLDD